VWVLPSSAVRRLVPPDAAPADSDPCLRGRTAALRGNSQLTRARCSGRTFRIPLINLIDRPLHYCLLGVAGCGGEESFGGNDSQKDPPVLRTRRPMEEQKMATKDCLLILGSYVGVPRCNKHTGGENGMHQVFPIEKGASNKAGSQGGYTLKL